MNDKTRQEEADELHFGALAMRHHGDAILDGTHVITDIPETYGYTLLAVAGWLETESQNLNLRTRPYALAIVRSFVHGKEEAL